MLAIVQTGYGAPDQVLVLRDVPRPEPGDGEVLVQVHAASLHPDVWHVVTGQPYVLRVMGAGLRTPKVAIPGTDMAGTVAALGPGASRFALGDAVFGETIRGMQWAHGGSFAEYVAVPEAWLAPKPKRIGFTEAATVPTSGIIALRALQEGRLQVGERVLVNGAAGGVGMFTVQLASGMGAHVTAVDVTARLGVLKRLHADEIVDGEKQDYTELGGRYDVVVDIPGNRPFGAVKRILAPAGRYVWIGHDAYGERGRRVLGSIPTAFGLMARSPFSKHIPTLDLSTPDKAAALAALRDWMEARVIDPVVDSVFPLDDIHGAFARLMGGKAKGRVVVVPTKRST